MNGRTPPIFCKFRRRDKRIRRHDADPSVDELILKRSRHVRCDSSLILVLCAIAGRDDAGPLGHANQIRHRGNAELLHNPAAMNFDRLLRRVQLRGNLFV